MSVAPVSPVAAALPTEVVGPTQAALKALVEGVTLAETAVLLELVAPDPAPVYNVGGGHEATLAEIVALLEDLAGETALLDRHPDRVGDVRRTSADTAPAHADLGWQPSVGLRAR